MRCSGGSCQRPCPSGRQPRSSSVRRPAEAVAGNLARGLRAVFFFLSCSTLVVASAKLLAHAGTVVRAAGLFEGFEGGRLGSIPRRGMSLTWSLAGDLEASALYVG